MFVTVNRKVTFKIDLSLLTESIVSFSGYHSFLFTFAIVYTDVKTRCYKENIYKRLLLLWR